MKSLKTLYLKTRIISLNPVLPTIMTEMTQQPISEYKKIDNLNNSLNYYTAKFLTHQTKDSSNKILSFEDQVSKNIINPDLFSEVEKLEYTRSLKNLSHFNDLDKFMNYLYDLNRNVNNLYVKMTMDLSNSNLFAYTEETKGEFINSLKETSRVYREAVEMCGEFKEWRDKINEDIGSRWSMIYALHRQNNEFDELFDEKSFDRYYFFK